MDEEKEICLLSPFMNFSLMFSNGIYDRIDNFYNFITYFIQKVILNSIQYAIRSN